MRIVSWT